MTGRKETTLHILLNIVERDRFSQRLSNYSESRLPYDVLRHYREYQPEGIPP